MYFKETGVHPMLAYMTSEDAGDLLDTTLIAKDGDVRCHAIIILSKLGLQHDQGESRDYTIIVPDFCVQDLEQMLSYCYIGRCISQIPEVLSSLLAAFNLNCAVEYRSPVSVDVSRGESDVPIAASQVSEAASEVSIVAREVFIEAREVSLAATDVPVAVSEVSIAASDVSIVANELSIDASEVSIDDCEMLIEVGEGLTVKLKDILSDRVPQDGQNNEIEIPVVIGKNKPGKENRKIKVLNPEELKCNYCEMVFKYKQNLGRHIKEYHLKKSDEFNCDSCKVVFRRKEHLEAHIASKSCLKSLSHECKNCKKMFSTAEKVKSHVLKNCAKKYFCSLCLGFFMKKKEFLSHNH